MASTVRAVYENGKFRPLDEVNLADGQEVELTILSEREQVLRTLGDLVVHIPPSDELDFDEEALQREIDEAFRGQPPLSETIIEERREGP